MSEGPEYATDQDRLQQELEGGPEIHIEAPKDPEVNPEVYRDVEPLLFRGFLTLSAEINGVHFVFKSLNQHEMDLLRLMQPSDRGSPSFWNLFLAYGVLMVDGVNVLPERDRWIPKIADTFKNFQPTVRNRIVRHISEINRRASNAVTLTECYAMEKYSRYRWYQLQSMDLTSMSVTGVPGTDRLGLNWAQLVWVALNRIEDLNDRQEQEWEHAKFIGSCFAGKGISKVYQQDADRRRKSKEERLARKDKLLRQILLGEKPEDVAKANGAVMLTARTVEELTDQLQRDLRGEKDWHDLVVDAEEQRIKDSVNQRRQQLEELAVTREQEWGGKSLFGGTDTGALTPAEVQERIAKRATQGDGDTSQTRWPELNDEKLRGVLDRYYTEPPSQQLPVPFPVFPSRNGPSRR